MCFEFTKWNCYRHMCASMFAFFSTSNCINKSASPHVRIVITIPKMIDQTHDRHLPT